MDQDLLYEFILPAPHVFNFVESFWMLENRSEHAKEVLILPDGRVDLFFSKSAAGRFQVTLLGIGTMPDTSSIEPKTTIFAISFKLPGVEYILKHPIASLINSGENLPHNFWHFDVTILDDFQNFCQKASEFIAARIPQKVDDRKLKLFDLVYTSQGSITVQELSENVYWTSRQINRYFQQNFGLSLKSYCGILRFRASFEHIKNGKLFPEGSFSDQSHFIKEVKKLSGVLPKDLHRNQNDRFIQFSTLPSQ